MNFSPRYRILTIAVVLQTAASLVQQGVGAIQPLIARSLHLDHQHLGLIVASLSAGSAAFAAIGGLAADYFGERALLLWSGVAMGLALCGAAVFPNLAWLSVCLFVFGMMYGTANPSGARAILLWFTRDRGLAMGIRQTAVPLGGAIGSLILPAIAARWGYQGAFFVAGIICIVATVASMHGYRQPEHHVRHHRQHLGEMWRGMLAVAGSWSFICLNLICSALVAVQYAALSFLAVALIALKHAPLSIAVDAMAIFQVGAVAGRLVWGTISDRVFGGDRIAPILLISAMTLGVLLWLAKSGTESASVIFLLSAAFGFSCAAWNGLWATAQAEIGGPRLAGSSLGASLTLIYIVGAIVPPVFGAVIDRTNFSVAWEILAVVVALGMIPGFFARRLLLAQQPA